jgi:hypothetical protein
VALALKRRQADFMEALNDESIDTLVLIGSVGTGKTDIAAFAVLTICMNFSKTRWLVIRRNISTAVRSVIPSYLDMADRMNLEPKRHYRFNQQTYIMTFLKNQSEIYFIEADITKDRQGRKIKGINATGNHIDEADELEETMYITATSRKGRRNQAGQPSISIVTMNPNDTYLKEKYYDPYKAGTLPPNVRVIEFDLDDSWQTEQDIEAMKTNPKWWVERYLYNNWEYADEDKTIFKSKLFDRARVETLKEGMRSAGYDVAREGKDRSVVADWEALILNNIEIVKDTTEQMETNEQAKWLIKHSDATQIGYENVAVDGVGLGVGVLDTGKELGVQFATYKSGFAPDPLLTFDDEPKSQEQIDRDTEMLSFNNLRSQMAYLFAYGMEKGYIKIYEGCAFYNELKKEAQEHHFEVKDKVFVLESKESIKKRTGKSPDIFDAVIMGLWKQLRKQAKIEWGGIR